MEQLLFRFLLRLLKYRDVHLMFFPITYILSAARSKLLLANDTENTFYCVRIFLTFHSFIQLFCYFLIGTVQQVK
jgi:hypothetical protein